MTKRAINYARILPEVIDSKSNFCASFQQLLSTMSCFQGFSCSVWVRWKHWKFRLISISTQRANFVYLNSSSWIQEQLDFQTDGSDANLLNTTGLFWSTLVWTQAHIVSKTSSEISSIECASVITVNCSKTKVCHQSNRGHCSTSGITSENNTSFFLFDFDKSENML